MNYTNNEIKFILENKGFDFLKLKLAEELGELNTALLQSFTKKSISEQDIIDELGDVYNYLQIYIMSKILMNPEFEKKIDERINLKKSFILKNYIESAEIQ